MEFSIANLLANFTDDKLIAPKALEKKLGCEETTSSKRLEIALDALEKIGILVKERGKYRRVSEEGVVEGKLRCSSKGFCFAIQDDQDSEDVYIRESQLSNAWNGDRVLVKVTKEGRRKRSPEGEVRLILERGNPSVIARVQQTERGLRGVPLDDRLLFELELQANPVVPEIESVVGQLVHAEILRYPLGQYPPIGTITQVLGSDAESAADADLVCCKYDLNRGFPEAALNAATALPAKLRKADLKNRLDLRPALTVALQPAGAVHVGSQAVESKAVESTVADPIDQALTLEQTGDGGWRLGVHVVDLSQAIPADSPLDREACKRGNAINLRGLLIPLFPPQLPLSLVPGEERLTISLLLTLSATGEIQEYELQRSAICLDQAVTAEQIGLILNPEATPSAGQPQPPEPVRQLVSQLADLAQTLRQQRYQRGSFDLTLPAQENYTGVDEGLLGVMVNSLTQPGHALLAELLVVANQVLISHLQTLGVPVIHRLQLPPDLYEIQEFIKLSTNLGIPLALQQEDTVQPQDLQNFTGQIQNAELAPVLMELLLEALKPATDSATPGPHFALSSVQGYGHFVSPLHRYTDILNQRALVTLLDHGKDRRTARAKEKVLLNHSSALEQVNWNVLPPEAQRDLEASISLSLTHLNERERIAQQAIKDLNGSLKVKQMQQRTGELFRGIITGIQSYGFFVEIEDFMVEGLVHVSSLKDDWYEYRSRQQTLIGRKNRRQYRLGDRVEVQVKSVDYYRQQIDLVVIGGGSQASEEELAEPVETSSVSEAELEAEFEPGSEE